MKTKSNAAVQDKRAKQWLLIGIVSFVALVIGVAAGYKLGVGKPRGDDRYMLATAEEIDVAKQEVRDKLTSQFSYECTHEDTEQSSEESEVVLEEYLKMNKYANRAVARDCSGIDTFLIKDIHGEWQTTSINISLDLRANPFWRTACLAEDILEADTVFRPENSHIDSSNFYMCQYFNQQAFTERTLQAESQEQITEEDVHERIKNYTENTLQYVAPSDDDSLEQPRR